MYKNIRIGQFHYLIVTVAGHTYILGKTGMVGHCQRVNTVNGAL
jgi:hypothetical protein